MTIITLTKQRFIETDKINDEVYRAAVVVGLSGLLDRSTTKPEVKEHIKAALVDRKSVSLVRR